MGSGQSKGQFVDLKLGSKLGEGAFGAVYKATHRETKELFAVKKFNLKPSERHMAQQEADAVARVSGHNNIVIFYDFHIDSGSGTAYLVLEFCDEGNLNDYILGRSPGKETCVQFCNEMMAGLTYIHSCNLAHRDLKPDNILISNGVCKIGDLGLAKAMEVLWGIGHFFTRMSQIYTYSAGGTPPFSAPEVIQRMFPPHTGHISGKCDVFSLGLVFLVMFSKETLNDRGRDVLVPLVDGRAYGEPIVTQSQIDSRVAQCGAPRDVIGVIGSMLQINPHHRVLPSGDSSGCSVM